MFGQLGWINFFDMKQRLRSISVLAWVIPLLWASLFIFIQLPVLMIISGGIVGSALWLLVVFATLHFRYQVPPAMDDSILRNGICGGYAANIPAFYASGSGYGIYRCLPNCCLVMLGTKSSGGRNDCEKKANQF